MKLIRVSGPLFFENLAGSMAGATALRRAGFHAECDAAYQEAPDVFAIYGVVWTDIEAANAQTDNLPAMSLLFSEIQALIEPHGGYCDEFGADHETHWLARGAK